MEYTEKYVKDIDTALEDSEFVAKLAKAENKDQLKDLFQQEKGITLEDETAQTAFKKIENVRNGGELSVEDLENVAGGFSRWAFVRSGSQTGAQWGAQLWGTGFGTMLGAVVGARIANNIFNMQF